jgi:hypothetical protein
MYVLEPVALYAKTIEELKSCTDWFIECGSDPDITPTAGKLVGSPEDCKLPDHQRNNKIYTIDKIFLEIWRPMHSQKHFVEVKIGDLELNITSNAYERLKKDIVDLHFGKKGMLYDLRCSDEEHVFLPEEFVKPLQHYDWKSLDRIFKEMYEKDEKELQKFENKGIIMPRGIAGFVRTQLEGNQSLRDNINEKQSKVRKQIPPYRPNRRSRL